MEVNQHNLSSSFTINLLSEIKFYFKTNFSDLPDIPNYFGNLQDISNRYNYNFNTERLVLQESKHPTISKCETSFPTNSFAKNIHLQEPLNPQPISSNLNTVSQKEIGTTKQNDDFTISKNGSLSFHVNDFDSFTYDPFAAAELDTINDIEELRHVLAKDQYPSPITIKNSVDLNSKRIKNLNDQKTDEVRQCLSNSLRDISFPKLLNDKESIGTSSNRSYSNIHILSKTNTNSHNFHTDPNSPKSEVVNQKSNLLDTCAKTELPTTVAITKEVHCPTEYASIIDVSVKMGFSKMQSISMALANIKLEPSNKQSPTSLEEKQLTFITQMCNLTSILDAQNVSEIIAITAVALFKLDFEKAQNFTCIAKELTDSGFSPDTVSSALVCTNVDKIKALHILNNPSKASCIKSNYINSSYTPFPKI